MQNTHKDSDQIFDIPSPKLHPTHSLIQPLPSVNSIKIQQLFNIPDLKTNKSYQNTVKNIMLLMNEFDQFTDNLQQKVDNLLAAQRNQFVDSYKQHMKKIQVQYRLLQQQVARQQQQIKYYQNQGKMSNLIKKVAMVQQQSKSLYQILAKKQKEIKSLELQNKVQKDQNKRLYGQVKQLLKSKNQAFNKLQFYQKSRELTHSQLSPNDEQNRQKFFPTQIHQQKSIKKDLSITTDDHKKAPGFSYNFSQHTINYPDQQYRHIKMKKQLENLTIKNRKLTKFNTRVLSQKNQLQNIFINSVYQIKKQITLKKKIKQCTYQDFTKQDKINLLLTIISNQQILRYVYQRIFGKGTFIKTGTNINTNMNTSVNMNMNMNNEMKQDSSQSKSKFNRFRESRGLSVNTNLHIKNTRIKTPTNSKLPYI